MTASGTAGHSDELARYFPLSRLGAVVVKSLSAEPWAGNPAPRLHGIGGGAMLNSVGLQNPGVESWLDHCLPRLLDHGARVVASIWGRTPEEYARAAALLAGSPIVAVEVNASCPNLNTTGGSAEAHPMFAHTPSGIAEVVEAAAAAGKPRWAKLTAVVADLPSIAAAAATAGAEAVTLVNTLPASAGTPRTPGNGPWEGGMSGLPLHAVARRAISECHAALPGLCIIGVGGVDSGSRARALLDAGASAVQVGTATLRDPRAAIKVLDQLTRKDRQ